MELKEGTKNDAGKPPLYLLPPAAIEEVAIVLGFGASKYSAYNWRKGLSYTRLMGAILRHLFAFLRGENNDPESGRSHLAHAVCGILFLLTFVLEQRDNLDDRYKGE